jgi:hypothetical protein
VDLAVALFVAAYLGLIPKDKVQTFFNVMRSVPVVGRMVAPDISVKGPPSKAARPGAKKRK